MADDDKVPEVEDKSSEKGTESSPVKGAEIISNRAEAADKYKSDMEQRKADYAAGNFRDTSSAKVLDRVSIVDGGVSLTRTAGRPAEASQPAAGEKVEGKPAASTDESSFGISDVGRKPTLFDPPRLDNPPGATVTRETGEGGYVKETVTHNGETVKNAYDPDGNLVTKTFELKDGRKVIVDYVEGQPGPPFILEADGSQTILTPVERPPGSKRFVLEGDRQDPNGRVVEKVSYIEGKLIYEDVNTHAKRGESFEPPSGDHITYQATNLGKYDPDTGNLVLEVDGKKVITPLASGRAEIQVPEGFAVEVAANGESSWQNKETGQAGVFRPDGSGVYLHGDGTLDRWSIVDGEFVHVKGEQLTQAEQDYLKKHPDVDLKDFAEIHERFHGDTAKLDEFYKSLEKIDTAKNLSEAEKTAIRAEIMDHVANPSEIYQGVTDSCNVAVFQRDLAMTNPAKYASTVVEAVSEGTFTAHDGTKTRLDVKNLKMADASGRDLASRIFQGATLQAELSPTLKYENTPDGVGRLKKTKDSPPGTPNEVAFTGLRPIEIADIRHKLTGEEKGVTVIKSEADLKEALELNGGTPMTILVDSSAPPFGEGGNARTAPNHIVTITGMEAGPPVKYLVANQWGLEHDHSTSLTAIPADELLANMSRRKTAGGSLRTDQGAVVYTQGDHTRLHVIEDGKKSSPQADTDDLNKGHRNPPKAAAKK
jgi:hypothetical protein